MRRYLLMVLVLFAIPHSLYGECILNLNQTESLTSPGNMAFYGGGDCLAVVQTTTGGSNNTIKSYSYSNCTISSSPSSVNSPGASSIAVSSNNCVASTNSSSILYYTVSGCSLSNPTSASAGTNTTALAFSPAGTCAISTIQGLQALGRYTVTGCALLELGQLVTPNIPVNVAFSPFTCNGNVFCAVLYSNSNTVGLFSVNAGGFCNLTSMGSITTQGNGGNSIAFSPVLCNGNILLAVDIGTQGLQLFSIDPSTCTATSVSFIDLTGSSYSFSSGYAFTPDGSCLISNDQFIPVSQTSTTNIYSVNPTTCALTNTSSINFDTNLTQGIAMHPSGNCLAISFPGLGEIQLYTITEITPVITVTVSPAVQVVCPGQALNFTATAVGTGPFTYNWTGPNGFSESTGSNPTLTIANPTATNTGSYSVTVNGTTTSSTVGAVVKSGSC